MREMNLRLCCRISSSVFGTMWIRVLLEKQTGPLLVKKFSTYCGTRRFITTFTSVCHLCLSGAGSIIHVRNADVNFTFQQFFHEYARFLLLFILNLDFIVLLFTWKSSIFLVILWAGIFSEIYAAIYCRMNFERAIPWRTQDVLTVWPP
jgi:hypothetical protein